MEATRAIPPTIGGNAGRNFGGATGVGVGHGVQVGVGAGVDPEIAATELSSMPVMVIPVTGTDIRLTRTKKTIPNFMRTSSASHEA